MDSGWHLNFKGSSSNNKNNSSRYNGKEDDSAKNYQVNINVEKWINHNLKLILHFYEKN